MEKRTYYFSDRLGNDENDGSIQSPFRSLKMAGKLNLNPQDEILLECGSVFNGQSLHLKNCAGTKDAPILISSYGEGKKPVIHADGGGIWYQNYGGEIDSPCHVWKGYVSSAVLLYDCEYLKVEGLEITNNPEILGEIYNQADTMSRTGIALVAQNKGTLHDIEICDCEIHDVKGNVYDKHLNNGGIYCTVLKPESESAEIARYDGIHIHHCVLKNCSRWGMAVGYSYTHSHFKGARILEKTIEKYGHTNVVLEYNYLENIGGDGITPMYCLRPLVQYNVSKDIAVQINDEVYTEEGSRGGKTAAAIWPWKCKDALFQYNEAYHTFENQDGQAWDADSGDGTIYQYNYSYNNGGGCVMFCLQESIHNIFRYNISVFDKGGVINPAENPDAHIYGNIFIVDKGVPFIRDNMSGGHLLVEKNLIYYTGEEPVAGDWFHQTEFARYHKNVYYNYADAPENDKEPVIKGKGENILQNPLSGPKDTDGKVHKKEDFSGFLPCKEFEGEEALQGLREFLLK